MKFSPYNSSTHACAHVHTPIDKGAEEFLALKHMGGPI